MGFQQGISGLNASATSIDVTSNNIANAKTVGFKSASASFADIFTGAGAGAGVRVLTITENHNNGTPTTTNRDLDIAINGNGFYRMKNDAGSVFFARNGQFTMDENSNITNMEGLYLTGYSAAGDPPVIQQGADPVQLSVPQTGMLAKPSTTGSMIVNLNSEHDSIPAATTFDPSDPDSYSYTSSVTVYDSLGNKHNISLYFIKGAVTTTNATWGMKAVDQSLPVTTPPGLVIQDKGPFIFDNNGVLTTPAAGATISIDIATLNGSADGTIALDFTGSIQQNYPQDNTVSLTQNGYAPGNFVGFSINPDGTIQGNYSNEQKKLLGQIVLANFTNLDGLEEQGDNLWLDTQASGQPMIGVAGQGTFGTLLSGMVEESNVDVANELVNLIQFQRNYQANSRSISTQSAILETLVSIR